STSPGPPPGSSGPLTERTSVPAAAGCGAKLAGSSSAAPDSRTTASWVRRSVPTSVASRLSPPARVTVIDPPAVTVSLVSTYPSAVRTTPEAALPSARTVTTAWPARSSGSCGVVLAGAGDGVGGGSVTVSAHPARPTPPTSAMTSQAHARRPNRRTPPSPRTGAHGINARQGPTGADAGLAQVAVMTPVVSSTMMSTPNPSRYQTNVIRLCRATNRSSQAIAA